MDMLRGSGHFVIGYLLGFTVFVVLRHVGWKRQQVNLYGPFLPLVLGAWAAVPYAFEMVGIDLSRFLGPLTHLFLFYPVLHENRILAAYLGNLNFSALLCGLLYIVLILHYWKMLAPSRVLKRKRKRHA